MSKVIYTKEVLAKAIEESDCLTEVFKKLGARQGGNSYQRIKALIQEYGLDTSHFLSGPQKGGRKIASLKKRKPEDILTSSNSRRVEAKLLRRALVEIGRPYICEECKRPPEWNGKSLTLQVDHIDGNWKDCRKENLRILCPNCHTQTPTYGNKSNVNKCENCSMKIGKLSRWCKRCCHKFSVRKRKIEIRPSKEVLLEEVKSNGYSATGRKYGVTDNTIRKWIKTPKIVCMSGTISSISTIACAGYALGKTPIPFKNETYYCEWTSKKMEFEVYKLNANNEKEFVDYFDLIDEMAEAGAVKQRNLLLEAASDYEQKQ